MMPLDWQEFGDMVAAKIVFGGYFIGHLSQIYAYLEDGRVLSFAVWVFISAKELLPSYVVFFLLYMNILTHHYEQHP